ncbi:fatty acid desaturase [Streptomyces massasporeus]|uniref:fatty acid desaturase n=1 Tax=Streptomyces massasporeus TaxID=67324 RepID=UPI0033A59B85
MSSRTAPPAPSPDPAAVRASGSPDVRGSMSRLPEPMQLPLTWLTGKPYTGQRGPSPTPGFHLAAGLVSLTIGLAVSTTALAAGGGWTLLLVVGWAVLLHALRNLRMMVYHQCAHRNMWARKRLDRTLGRVIAGLLLVQDFDGYAREHVGDHHALRHMTPADPTVQAILVSLELRPGMTRSQMWRRVLGRIVSPVFHARFTTSRVRSYLAAAPWPDRLLAAGAHGLALVAAGMTGTLVWLLLAWLVPFTVLYQTSNVLRLCVRHTFPGPEVRVKRGREYFGGLTNAVFLGEPAPRAGQSPGRAVAAWTRWGVRMLTVHLPSRYLVLTGDTVCHDYHHRYPMSRQWADYLFARQRDLEAGHPGWPPYQEVWGLVPAIDAVFDSLRTADPGVYDRARLPKLSERALFSAFED